MISIQLIFSVAGAGRREKKKGSAWSRKRSAPSTGGNDEEAEDDDASSPDKFSTGLPSLSIIVQSKYS